MASGEDKKNAKVGKGFAGLSSMMSDIDVSIKVAAPKNPTQSSIATSSGKTRPPPQATPESQPEPSGSANQPVAKEQSGGSRAGKGLLAVGGVIGVLWLIGSMMDQPSFQRSLPKPIQVEVNAPTPLNQFDKQPVRGTEEMPPVGTSLVLAPAQLRYCLSEAIRIDASRSTMNNYRQSDVDRFNATVDDYNSRCGKFRYRGSSLDNAKNEVERSRSVLEAEGRARFFR